MRARIGFAVLVAVGLAGWSGKSMAQTPADAFNNAFLTACAGAASGSALASQCALINGGGPGSGVRRASTSVGNQLNVVPAQGRIASQSDAAGTNVDARRVFDAWTLQASAGFGGSDRDDSGSEAGFDNDRVNALVGLDYRLSDRTSVGIALTWERDETDFDNGAGEQELSAFGVVGHALWTPAPLWTIYAQAGFGSVDLDTRREIDFNLVFPGIPGNSDVRVTSTAFGSTEGDRLLASFGVQRALIEGEFNLRLDAGFDYERTEFDALRETGGDGFAVALPGRSIRSSRSKLGFSGDFVASNAQGVMTPYARAWWRHEFSNDGRAVTARLVDDANATPIVFLTPDPDRNFFELAFGLAWVFSGGRSFYVDVETLLGDDILSGYHVSVGGSIEF